MTPYLLTVTMLNNIVLRTMAGDLPAVFAVRSTCEDPGTVAAVHTAWLISAAVGEGQLLALEIERLPARRVD